VQAAAPPSYHPNQMELVLFQDPQLHQVKYPPFSTLKIHLEMDVIPNKLLSESNSERHIPAREVYSSWLAGF
jgi:hypothetical protein